MFKKFVEGLVFGSGFGLAFVAIVGVALYLFMTSDSMQEPHYIGEAQVARPGQANFVDRQIINPGDLNGVPFHELSIDDQINQSSVIALLKYEKAPDGKMIAIIKEFLKKDPGVTLHYKVGDEYANASRYLKTDEMVGDGVIVFMAGSPAMMRMSMSFSDDRIDSLGNLPLAVLKEKCANPVKGKLLGETG